MFFFGKVLLGFKEFYGLQEKKNYPKKRLTLATIMCRKRSTQKRRQSRTQSRTLKNLDLFFLKIKAKKVQTTEPG